MDWRGDSAAGCAACTAAFQAAGTRGANLATGEFEGALFHARSASKPGGAESCGAWATAR